ncbi:MAG: hypothetical protein CVT90_00110 [Candidatus Altiarchaeales archaeon HGW-Altiarchaeales-3]|nr:MAG: hypothetical protein CVT90_00110 [Candidatus Altiarchaeales archaeon HGW-Altiarchaeales-3]
MSYDFYADFWDDRRCGANFRGIDEGYKSGKVYSKIKLAALHLNTLNNKNWAKKNKYTPYIKSDYISNVIVPENERMERLNIKEPNLSISALLQYSAFIKINFKLKKPYISRDDEEFYIIDNPVSKEKVFKVPYVRASSWKGNLRWVMGDVMKVDTDITKRICGNDRNESEDKELKRGRLQFYPTFFNKIGLDVINPHDRKTKTGKNPILYEVVPDGASGTFSLLYVPFDLIGNEKELKKQVHEDLEVISDAVEKLLTVYGFSAKKTSGYGIAELKDKFFDINCPESEKKEFKKIISNAIKI